MILQLQQIVFNYDKTAEGEKAKKILSYLKSDLEGNSQSKEIDTPSVPVKHDNQKIKIQNPIEEDTNFEISDDFD